jgi:hypothetical protein
MANELVTNSRWPKVEAASNTVRPGTTLCAGKLIPAGLYRLPKILTNFSIAPAGTFTPPG